LPADRRVGQFLEEQVGLAVEDAVALGLDDGATDSLGNVALAGARRAEEEGVFMTVDELASGRATLCPGFCLGAAGPSGVPPAVPCPGLCSNTAETSATPCDGG
jgi:hypothetical protein